MADKPLKDLSFEDALKELEDIVARLERGDAPLEESITIYQRGAALKAHCDAKLKDAQMKVEKIVLDGKGSAGTEPFDA
ncbi:exodeoxyribonuclease VII small subunit [Litorimonas taeanensis]|uniref:Exodeoxyribonuclease 7 small subunit n=1 Tax=Litorimonas taeanensis TaxID=568099 RepID=A0A420WIM0_9PROT|nr:exodeoxyribonuclease VII small subunit [Litorimonas taeanensis]RKQ70848.1 exodeoxyribonuclease VII small subunit [Litorimonas taeanensis]